jgi:hypothetical protein
MEAYKLLAGSFAWGGKTYKRGDVIPGRGANLKALFPSQFQTVDEQVVEPIPPPVKKPEALKTEKPAMVPMTEVPKPPKETKPEGKVVLAEPEDSKKGRDVTQRFPLAVENDFIVLRVTEGYLVYDEDDLSKSMNEKPVKKNEVTGVIRKALEG